MAAPQPSARKTAYGYKAVAIYPSGRTHVIGTRYRLTEDGRDYRQAKAAGAYVTREEAIAVATRWIAANEEADAISRYRYEQAHITGRRPSEAEARAALSSPVGVTE